MFECVFTSFMHAQTHTYAHCFLPATLKLRVWLNLAGLICSLQTCQTDKKEEERRQRKERRNGETERGRGRMKRRGIGRREQVSEMVSACQLMTKTT